MFTGGGLIGANHMSDVQDIILEWSYMSVLNAMLCASLWALLLLLSAE